MNYLIAVFKSRSQVLEFIEIMRKKGVFCTSVQTPAEARVGCGVSAKFMSSNLELAKVIIMQRNLTAFHAIYRIERIGMRVSTRRI